MKKGILLTILLCFLFPSIVFAESSATTEISGINNAKPGDIIAYDINVSTIEGIKASNYEAILDYNKDVLELKTITAKDWKGNSTSNNLKYTYKDGISGSSLIATVTFKVKDNVPKQTTIIALKDVKVTVLDEEENMSIVTVSSDQPSLKVSLSIKSTDNTLKSIKIDGGAIDGFKKDVFEYEIDLDAAKDKIDLTSEVNNANASFVDGFGNRKVNLNYGENEVLIKVKSESGEIQVYKLIINREDDRNTNNNLKEIIINSGKLKLNLTKNKVDYTIKTYKLKTLEIDAVAMDPKAKVEVSVPKEIVVGENVAIITVTSEMGEEKIYTITFDNSDKDIDTKIKTLYISGVNFDFDKNTMVYEIAYNKKLKKGLDIKIVTVSGNNLVDYKIFYNDRDVSDDDKIDLKVGDKYEIRVFPLGLEEGDESESTTYTIKIVKDKRVNFFFVLETLIIIVLMILIIIQIIKMNRKRGNIGDRKNVKNKGKEVVADKDLKKEITKTKVISEQELEKINEISKK